MVDSGGDIKKLVFNAQEEGADVLPVLSETSYGTLISNPTAFRHYLELWAAKNPEIFPPESSAGFWFHDFVTSRKLNLRMRRIQLVETGEVYQLRPEFAMPYMVGRTDEVEKGLFLQRYGVPFDALATCLGATPATGTELVRH